LRSKTVRRYRPQRARFAPCDRLWPRSISRRDRRSGQRTGGRKSFGAPGGFAGVWPPAAAAGCRGDSTERAKRTASRLALRFCGVLVWSPSATSYGHHSRGMLKLRCGTSSQAREPARCRGMELATVRSEVAAHCDSRLVNAAMMPPM
jgi:hypothetical protein